MEKNKTEELQPIDLFAVFHQFSRSFRRLGWLIVVLSVILGAATYLHRKLTYVPQYRCAVTLSVGINNAGNEYDFYADGKSTEQVVAIFPYILQSETMQDLLYQLTGGNPGGSLRAESIADTNVFELSATGSNPQKTYDLVQAAITAFPQACLSVIGNTQLRIITPAQIPASPINPFSAAASALPGAFIGLVAALALILLHSLIYTTVCSADDVKKISSLSCLSKVPRVAQKARSSKRAVRLLVNREWTDQGFREAFHLLRVRLLRKLDDRDRVILFTSSIPSEGKSSIAANTAISLTKDGYRVLLVDGDLRNPSIKPLLGIQQESMGLGDYLSGEVTNIKFYRYEETSLYIFAGDKAIANPSPLLQHGKLKGVFKSLRPMFDYIIVDTPPCCTMGDAAALSRHADKVVYVIREDYATARQIRAGIQDLSAADARICGFVLNMTTHHGSKGSGYGSCYGYGYGYGYGKSGKHPHGEQ